MFRRLLQIDLTTFARIKNQSPNKVVKLNLLSIFEGDGETCGKLWKLVAFTENVLHEQVFGMLNSSYEGFISTENGITNTVKLYRLSCQNKNSVDLLTPGQFLLTLRREAEMPCGRNWKEI